MANDLCGIYSIVQSTTIRNPAELLDGAARQRHHYFFFRVMCALYIEQAFKAIISTFYVCIGWLLHLQTSTNLLCFQRVQKLGAEIPDGFVLWFWVWLRGGGLHATLHAVHRGKHRRRSSDGRAMGKSCPRLKAKREACEALN